MGKRGPKPGTVKKTGGRQKGTPNKRTQGFIEKIESLGLEVPSEVYRLLGQLDELDALLNTTSKEKIQYEEDFDEESETSLKRVLMTMPHKLNIIRLRELILSNLMQYLYPKRKPQEDPELPEEPTKTRVYVLYDEDESNSKISS